MIFTQLSNANGNSVLSANDGMPDVHALKEKACGIGPPTGSHAVGRMYPQGAGAFITENAYDACQGYNQQIEQHRPTTMFNPNSFGHVFGNNFGNVNLLGRGLGGVTGATNISRTPRMFGGALGALVTADNPATLSPNVQRQLGNTVSVDYIDKHCALMFGGTNSPSEASCVAFYRNPNNKGTFIPTADATGAFDALKNFLTPFATTAADVASNVASSAAATTSATPPPKTEKPFFDLKNPKMWLAIGGGVAVLYVGSRLLRK